MKLHIDEDRIEKQIELKAPRARVWRALTDHREFSEWFGVNLESPFAAGQPTAGSNYHSRLRAHSLGSGGAGNGHRRIISPTPGIPTRSSPGSIIPRSHRLWSSSTSRKPPAAPCSKSANPVSQNLPPEPARGSVSDERSRLGRAIGKHRASMSRSSGLASRGVAPAACAGLRRARRRDAARARSPALCERRAVLDFATGGRRADHPAGDHQTSRASWKRPAWCRGEMAGRECLFEVEPEPLEEVRDYLALVGQRWEEALVRLKRFVET